MAPDPTWARYKQVRKGNKMPKDLIGKKKADASTQYKYTDFDEDAPPWIVDEELERELHGDLEWCEY